MAVSGNPGASIVTYSLGSCIGIAIHDPAAGVGGILHFLLPESKLAPEKAKNNPCMFCDTGILSLFKAAYKLGAKKQRMRVIVVGGSQIMDQKGFFNIGKRNYMATKRIFCKNNVLIDYEDVGGNSNRTLMLDIGSGKVKIKTSGEGERVI